MSVEQQKRALELLDLHLATSFEGCDCPACKALDMERCVDLLAETPDGQPVFVAYRYQPDFTFETITVRYRTDRGGQGTEFYKIVEGLSLAALHVQDYGDHIVSISGPALSRVLTSGVWCLDHPSLSRGSGGQIFAIVCPKCSEATVTRYPAVF